MNSSQVNLSFFSLVGVIMLVLAGACFVYLLQLKNKSSSSRMLLWFFLCVTLSSIATILTNIGTDWEWAFAPYQDAFLIIGGVFLVRFAYWYPANDQPGEARWVVSIFTIIALAALGYATFFAIRYFSNLPADLDENRAFYLLTPLTITIGIVIFFKRSIHWSARPIELADKASKFNTSFLKALFRPGNPPAIAHRNYGLALAVGLIPVVVTLIKPVLPDVVASFLFNFGVVAAIAAIMLVYLNHAPEPTSIYARLVGISLVTILLILGLASVLFFSFTPITQVHDTVVLFIFLVLLSSLLIITLFPLFFRTSLLNPLSRLLTGVNAANQGNLDTRVDVQYEDEIGFLTHSFNRMVSSLNVATQALKDESVFLEKQVADRTAELRETNQQLISENSERKGAEARLDRQLRYEMALAGCSGCLLFSAENESSQQQVLNQAIEHLRTGAQASRAYIFRNFEDPELGYCMGILAEACAQDVRPHITNPVNQRARWSLVPENMFVELKAGNPYGGPVAQVFSSTPELMNALLNQSEPLLSIQTFPIILNKQMWGFVGFDDCRTPRQWDELEIRMLSTASEMIGNTIQRWQTEARLLETLSHLEARVQERTIEFAQANAELKREIYKRQRFQRELEERLKIEKTLAGISARLLSPMDLEPAIRETLGDLGQMMQANRITFLQLPPNSINRSVETIEWHTPDTPPLSEDQERNLNATYSWFGNQLAGNKSVYLPDLSALPSELLAGSAFVSGRKIDSLLLVPLIMENRLAGVIVCCNPSHQKARTPENVQTVEVVASMLSSLLNRDQLLNILEEKVAERTRELFAFFDLAILAGETQEIADILQSALVKIMEISASEAAVVHLFDGDQRSLKLVAHQGFLKDYLLHLQTIQLNDAMMTWLEDMGDEPGPSGLTGIPADFVIPGFISAYHIALRARGKLQGLLSCYWLVESPYDPYQSSFLTAIGEQLGMAVENYRLRQKAEEIATIQERQRLARELHDAVSQSLYSLTLFARSGRDALEVGDQAKLSDSLEQLELNSLVALKEMRLLLYQLRSLALEEGGLLAAIETRFNLVERRLGIQAVVQMDENLQLTDQVELELFRLITEALNNALKHAGANQVSVTLQSENGQVALAVKDNGRGFDLSQASAGMGLQNLRERVSALDGQIEISSQPGSGTRIRVEIPQLNDPTGKA